MITCNTVGWTWTGDPTHSRKLLNELNFGGAKVAVTRGSKATGMNDPHREDNLTPEKTAKLRSLAGRLPYHSLDDPRVQFETWFGDAIGGCGSRESRRSVSCSQEFLGCHFLDQEVGRQTRVVICSGESELNALTLCAARLISTKNLVER